LSPLLLFALVTCDGGTNPDAGLSSFDRCIAACVDAHPTGKPLFDTWNACIETACAGMAPGEEREACEYNAFAPENPSAPCASQTDACFAGPTMGCKELALYVEAECEPDTLPIPEAEFFGVALCVIEKGWQGTRHAQALAWPLYMCAFNPNDFGGCATECMGGGAACRTCAQERCGALYTACMEDTAAPPTDLTIPAEKADCQALQSCGSLCQP
jgi:hypothetical protein